MSEIRETRPLRPPNFASTDSAEDEGFEPEELDQASSDEDCLCATGSGGEWREVENIRMGAEIARLNADVARLEEALAGLDALAARLKTSEQTNIRLDAELGAATARFLTVRELVTQMGATGAIVGWNSCETPKATGPSATAELARLTIIPRLRPRIPRLAERQTARGDAGRRDRRGRSGARHERGGARDERGGARGERGGARGRRGGEQGGRERDGRGERGGRERDGRGERGGRSRGGRSRAGGLAERRGRASGRA